MRLLADTCTFLWLAADDPQLSKAARDACRDPGNDVYLSALSAWEIALEHRLGRLPLPEPPPRYVTSRRAWLRLLPLPFDEECAAHDALLPRLHRDPFDRGLVSQAILNGLTIVTPDPAITSYRHPRSGDTRRRFVEVALRELDGHARFCGGGSKEPPRRAGSHLGARQSIVFLPA